MNISTSTATGPAVRRIVIEQDAGGQLVRTWVEEIEGGGRLRRLREAAGGQGPAAEASADAPGDAEEAFGDAEGTPGDADAKLAGGEETSSDGRLFAGGARVGLGDLDAATGRTGRGRGPCVPPAADITPAGGLVEEVAAVLDAGTWPGPELLGMDAAAIAAAIRPAVMELRAIDAKPAVELAVLAGPKRVRQVVVWARKQRPRNLAGLVARCLRSGPPRG